MSRATFNELLIAEVAKRPILWDVKSKHFRNKQKKMILWEKVAEILKEVDESVTADELQARWKNLKDTLRKKQKKRKKIKKSGAAAPSKTAYWPHTEQMTFLRDVLEPRRSISNMDASEETAVPTSLPVEPLNLPSQAFRNSSDVDNCPATRNPFEIIFQEPSVPERVTTPPNPPPHHPPPGNPPPSNTPLSNPLQGASCPRESEEVSSTPQQRSKQQRKRELETVDDELNTVRNVIAAHKAMDASGASYFIKYRA
nr:chromatin modification-related protein EAF1-like [Rhipicephalus microplus]